MEKSISGAAGPGSSRPGSREAVGSVSAVTRSVAVTILATVLRFATYIQCPNEKQRDEHILPTLVALIREDSVSSTSRNSTGASNSRTDAKIKRRCMAALGEVLFYISSQENEEEVYGEDSLRPHKWTVPSGCIGCVVRCLRDEGDEILRHYAAKTIENIMAQGSPEHKRKFVTVDIACRLLELSQYGRNEVMQACCGMSLSHMFLFVMTLDPANRDGVDNPTSSVTTTGVTKSPSSGNKRPGSAGSGSGTGRGVNLPHKGQFPRRLGYRLPPQGHPAALC